MKVLLVERRTFLGTEITASLRPWLQRDGFTEWSRELKSLFLPQEEQDEVGVPFDLDNVSTVFGNEIPLFAGTTKNS
jgi:hypothetical protein